MADGTSRLSLQWVVRILREKGFNSSIETDGKTQIARYIRNNKAVTIYYHTENRHYKIYIDNDLTESLCTHIPEIALAYVVNQYRGHNG